MGTKPRADKKVSLRLTSDQEEALEEIVLTKGYKNRSQVLRAALENFIESSHESYNTEKITIELPKVYTEELDKLLDFVGAQTRHEAIRMAIRQYLQSENEFLLNKTLEYQELRVRYRKESVRPREMDR